MNTNTDQRLQANIPKLLFMSFFHMFLVIIPVIVPFWQSHGLEMGDVYLLQSIFAISVVILEVPSGYISDLLGRKNSLLVAGIISGTAWLIFVNSETIIGFAAFEVMVSIAVSLISGTDVALIYDSIQQMREKKYNESRILGQKMFYTQVGETIASLLGGILALYSLSLPAQITAIAAWIPFLIALTLYEPPRQKMQRHQHRENFRYIYKSLFKHSRLLTLIFANLMVYGVATLLVVWAYQGYWKEIGTPLYFFGYLWAGYNLSVALVGKMAHLWEKRLGAPAIILIIGIFPILGYLGMGFFASWIGILCGLLFQICRGLTGVVLRDALNSRVTGDMRATANSISSLGVRLSFAFLGPLLGWLIDHNGYSTGFFVMAGVYFLAFLFVSLPLLAQQKHFKPVS